MRKIITITLAGVVAVLAAQMSSHAAQTFDGLWVTSRKDCRDKDGPDSKTFIDLDNVIKGKPAPLVRLSPPGSRAARADDVQICSTA